MKKITVLFILYSLISLNVFAKENVINTELEYYLNQKNIVVISKDTFLNKVKVIGTNSNDYLSLYEKVVEIPFTNLKIKGLKLEVNLISRGLKKFAYLDEKEIPRVINGLDYLIKYIENIKSENDKILKYTTKDNIIFIIEKKETHLSIIIEGSKIEFENTFEAKKLQIYLENFVNDE